MGTTDINNVKHRLIVVMNGDEFGKNTYELGYDVETPWFSGRKLIYKWWVNSTSMLVYQVVMSSFLTMIASATSIIALPSVIGCHEDA